MKVLSLFDGVSCARLALERAEIQVEAYFASEVDKYAIKVTQANRPDTVQIGDVRNRVLPLGIDLIIGGSPCQDLSIAKKDRKGLDGDRSSLFWEYVRILNEVKPKYFILENVNSMPKEAKDLISKTLGVEPVMINASLVSAQNRKRLFWVGSLQLDGTYKQVKIPQPKDKGIYLKDILEENVDEKYFIDTNTFKTGNSQGNKVHSIEKKSVCLSANGGGGAKTGLYCISSKQAHATVSVDKSTPMVSAMGMGGGHVPMITEDFEQIRKLTPIECERLQGMPETEKSVIIEVCLDIQKNSVSVENQNLKSQSVVGNAEKEDLKETVLSVINSLSINYQPINKLAQPVVVINCEESKIEISNQGKLLLTVDIAGKQNLLHPLVKTEDFVQIVASIMQIADKIISFGKEELPQNELFLTHRLSGKNVVSLSGNEIMQLARDAEIDSTTLKELLKFTTLDLSTQEKTEQIMKILFFFVILVINGFIPKETQNQNILLQIKQKRGWTNPTGDISNSQRYKMCGNAFNVDVVAHIIKQIKHEKNY